MKKFSISNYKNTFKIVKYTAKSNIFTKKAKTDFLSNRKEEEKDNLIKKNPIIGKLIKFKVNCVNPFYKFLSLR